MRKRLASCAAPAAFLFVVLPVWVGQAQGSPGEGDPGALTVSSTVTPVCDPAGLRFDIEVCNAGASTFDEVELEEKLPPGMVILDGTMTGAGPCAEDGPAAAACPCEGGVTFLRVRYAGEQCADVSVIDDKTVIFGPATLCPGSPPFEIYGSRADGRFRKNNLIFTASGTETVVHVSCSQPIGVGSVFGPFVIEAMASRNGGIFDGTVCVPPPASCPCKGGVTYLQLAFNGEDGTPVTVEDKGTIIYSGTLNNGDVFELWGSRSDGRFMTNDLILNAADQDTVIHVSCSRPIGVGSVFGPFAVVAFASRDGGWYEAPCDAGQSASGGGKHEDEFEVCLDSPLEPGSCALVSYVATFDASACVRAEVEGEAAASGGESETKTSLCYGQALASALAAACQGCAGPPPGSLCGVDPAVCPTQEQQQCLFDYDALLAEEWANFDIACSSTGCVCGIGG
ncbi:MAG: hypothetical protein D6815_06295 [Candidatus Dadabacteria bacterium]|nr:MAG: hypothetical protein D6815_06295 [Candidatus Dadabacteria bacterium]